MDLGRALFTLMCAVGIATVRVQPPGAMPGYSTVSADVQRRVEAAAIALPSPVNAADYARALSREPHMAGTPAQARTRDYIIDLMRSWGLETSVRTYEVWMPHPTSVQVWRMSPDSRELTLTEGPVRGDSTSLLPEVPPIDRKSVV